MAITAEQTPFEYGWCKTDWKNGKTIPEERPDGVDYFAHEPYASSVKEMLTKLRMPLPEDEQIYRGIHHDLLFLNSHGVVVRVGPTDVEDLIHPAVLQPLGWVDDKENEITIAIYPGIELYEKFLEFNEGEDLKERMNNAMRRSGHAVTDNYDRNIGVLRLRFNGAKEQPVALLLDVDNEFCGSKKTSEPSEVKSFVLEKALKNGQAMPRAIQMALNSMSYYMKYTTQWEKAFQIHQPLRNLFWLAWRDSDKNGGEPDKEYMQSFWRRCAEVTNNPEQITDPRTGDVFEMGLYRPWTGALEDRKAIYGTEEERWLDDVCSNPKRWKNLPDQYAGSNDFIRRAILANIELTCYLPGYKLYSDEIQCVIWDAVKHNIASYQKLPSSLQEDPDFAFECLRLYGSYMHTFWPDALKEDRAFILRAINKDQDVFWRISEDFLGDRNFVMEVCLFENVSFEYIPKKYRDDCEFVRELVQKRPELLEDSEVQELLNTKPAVAPSLKP